MIINLIIAHSHPVFMVIWQNVLRSYNGFNIIGKATTAAELLKAASVLKPDIILADMGLPGMKGFAALQKLAACSQQSRVILSWQHHQQPVIGEAIAAGCAGCITQEASPSAINLAIKKAINGQVFFCEQTERAMSTLKKKQNTQSNTAERLNEKYTILLYCALAGWNIKEAAIAAGLTVKTVYTYRKRLKKILGSLSSTTIEAFMKENGLEL